MVKYCIELVDDRLIERFPDFSGELSKAKGLYVVIETVFTRNSCEEIDEVFEEPLVDIGFFNDPDKAYDAYDRYELFEKFKTLMKS